MFLTLLRRLFFDRRGNFGLLTAGLLIPLAGCIGLAIDVTRALDVRNQLSGLADSAALAALAPRSAALTALSHMGVEAALRRGEEEARAVFETQMSSRLKSFGASANPTMSFTEGVFRVSMDYRASVPSTFLTLLGIKSVPVSGRALTELRPEEYRDFYLLLDNSPSMGIASSRWDYFNMTSVSPERCAFACHAMDLDSRYATLAEDSNARTRIDVVRAALESMFASMKSATHVPGQYRMAIHTFGAKAENLGLTTVAPLTDDIIALRRGAEQVKLMSTPTMFYKSGALSPIDGSLAKLVPIVGKGGTGLSTQSRDKVVMLVTDGVTDIVKVTGCSRPLDRNYRCQEPINTSACTTLKNNGVRIAVLYTTYIDLWGDKQWEDWIWPIRKQIMPAARDCASPGLFFEVGMDQGIDEAMNALFRQLLATARVIG